MLDNRLSGSFDYFIKNNVNMLIPLTGPSAIGSVLPDGNNGKLRTKGWEAVVNWADQVGSDFSYGISINMGEASICRAELFVSSACPANSVKSGCFNTKPGVVG